MFPASWPGKGLLVLRLTEGVFLLHDGIVHILGASQPVARIVGFTAGVIGAFVLIGLWTPIAGVLCGASAISLLIWGSDDPRNTIWIVCVGLSISMLGPGVWSIDAAIFGRQRIDLPER